MPADQDMEASAVLIAKALFHPETIAAMRRYVVNVFTDEQEELIKSLFEAGKTTEAQKIMLDAMNKAYGGSERV